MFRGEPGAEPIWEDHGTLTIACTHNDAVSLAELYAPSLGVVMKPRGQNGTWMGSEVLEGEGMKAEVWVDRGPAEEDYDKARLEAEG
jgi:hypothetical protein